MRFTFKSSDERIPAHKFILAVFSPVFETEFFDSMTRKDEILIEDADADAFKEFLQFSYLQKVKLSMEHIQSVMHLGKKYQVDKCLKGCSEFIKRNLSFDEINFGYELAIQFDQNDLKDFLQRKIVENADKVLYSEEFLNCNWNVLNDIVKNGNINCKESVLLDACIDWALNACERNELNPDDMEDIRSQLKDVIYNIRFIQFSVSELAKHLIDWYDLYSKEELKEIICVMGGEMSTSNKFNSSNRSKLNVVAVASDLDSNHAVESNSDIVPNWDNKNIIECVRWMDPIHDYDVPEIHSTIFSSSIKLLFGEFKVHFKPWDFEVSCDISIGKVEYVEVMQRFTTKIITQPGHLFSIVLPKKIIIEPKIKYIIELDFSSNEDIELKYFWSNKPQVQLENGATITFHPDDSLHFDNVDRGLISILTFNKTKQ